MRSGVRFSLLILLVTFSLQISSCSAWSVTSSDQADQKAAVSGASSELSEESTEIAEPAAPLLSIQVTLADGTEAADAGILIVSSGLDRQIHLTTSSDGTAVTDETAEGIWFVRVTKAGYCTQDIIVPVAKEGEMIDITLEEETILPRYLLSYTMQTSEGGPTLIGLAQSENGKDFTAFPGWVPMEGTGGGVTVLDGYLCVYTDTGVIRYNLNSKTWETRQPFQVYSEAGLQNEEQDFFGALMRDVRFFQDPDAGLVAIGGDLSVRFDYSNFFEESLAQNLISLVGYQTPLPDAGGLLLYRPDNTKISGRIVDDLTDRDASFVLLPAPDGGRYLLTTTADGLHILHGDALGQEYKPTETPPDGIMYKGSIAGVTGFYDETSSSYTLYGVRNSTDKQMYIASIPSFEEPVDLEKTLIPVDMQFVDPAAITFSNPVIWDSSETAAERFSDTANPQRDDLTLSSEDDDYEIYPLMEGDTTSTFYSAMKEFGINTVEITSGMAFVTACESYTPSNFVLSAAAPAGTNLTAAGLVYAWNPSGSMPGGFYFTVSKGKWTLSTIVPETLSTMRSGSTILSEETLLSGEFAGDAANAVLTVAVTDGHQILLIDGEIVAEYDVPESLNLLRAGYVGLIAVSGEDEGGAKFQYSEPRLLIG